MAFTPYNQTLTKAQQKQNALEIGRILTTRGWTLNAIAAVLGNFERECTINPNLPQNATGFPTSTASRNSGFGLPQWTPWYTRYGSWCANRGIAVTATDSNPAGQIRPQLDYLDYECTYGIEGGRTWYSNEGYTLSWSAFKTSDAEPGYLAAAFYYQYERSGSGNPGNRPELAEYWYEYLSKQNLNEPMPIWLLFKLKQHNRRF